MSRPDFPRTILEFQERFGTEEACRAYVFGSRWPDGSGCPGSGARDAGGETRRHLWICTSCGRQTSVTAGTVMHGTRLPLRTWFWAAYLVSTFHRGISAKQLQRQLGIRCHETAWAMLHKLRGAMIAPERELLNGAARQLPPPAPQAECGAGRPLAAPRAPRDQHPQGLDARHPPRCLARPPARLPRRVRLPPQPPTHPDGRLQTLLSLGLAHAPITYRDIIDRAA